MAAVPPSAPIACALTVAVLTGLVTAAPAAAGHRACTTILSDATVDRILGPTRILRGEHRYKCNYRHAGWNTIVDLWPAPGTGGIDETARQRYRRLKAVFRRATDSLIRTHDVRGADAAFSYSYCPPPSDCPDGQRPGGFVVRDGRHLAWLEGGERFIDRYRRLARAMVRRL